MGSEIEVDFDDLREQLIDIYLSNIMMRRNIMNVDAYFEKLREACKLYDESLLGAAIVFPKDLDDALSSLISIISNPPIMTQEYAAVILSGLYAARGKDEKKK